MSDGGGRTIYLLHFERPLIHARHYLGSAGDLDARLRDHASGCGARITAVCRSRGIGWRLVRTWSGSRDDERRLKRRHDTPRMCPVCAELGGRQARPASLSSSSTARATPLRQQS